MSFLNGFLATIAKWIIENLIKKINDYLLQKKLEAERKERDKKTLDELMNSIKEGKPDNEVSKKAEDFLNSIDRN